MWGRAFPEGWANTKFFCCACEVEQRPTAFLWLPGYGHEPHRAV